MEEITFIKAYYNILQCLHHDEPNTKMTAGLTEVISKISMPSKKDVPELLEAEYREILGQIRRMKNFLE